MNTPEPQISSLIPNINIHTYLNVDLRNKYPPIISEIVNSYISPVKQIHKKEDEIKLKTDGYLIFDNFLSQNEVDKIKNKLIGQEGYNTHVPKYSDQVLRKLTPEYNFNTLSYPPTALLNEPIILNKIIDPYILSLSQAYLGCFPTLYSLNSWWHIYKGNTYGTQNNHRDHDDFRFLALFIYLTDVDETTGPHVFYPGTQDGSESDKSITITGKAGTAILADTFAIHRGQPLQQKSRLVCWWRYGLYTNAMHYYDGNNNFKSIIENIFSNISNTPHNEYLFRAFY
jgi:hypothetical protein